MENLLLYVKPDPRYLLPLLHRHVLHLFVREVSDLHGILIRLELLAEGELPLYEWVLLDAVVLAKLLFILVTTNQNQLSILMKLQDHMKQH